MWKMELLESKLLLVTPPSSGTLCLILVFTKFSPNQEIAFPSKLKTYLFQSISCLVFCTSDFCLEENIESVMLYQMYNEAIINYNSIHWYNAFIHSRYFYSASSSPLLLRCAPDYNINTVSELTLRSATGTTSQGITQGPYVVTRMGFEPATFRTQGTEPTTKPTCPTVCTQM